jgi:hypothetical protein
MKLGPDLREFIELLNSQSVDFLIVGAHALAWHGLPRYTKDIDFLVRADVDNAQALIRVLEQFGFGSLGLQIEDFTAPNQIVQLGREPNRIDLLTSISGVSWAECWDSKVHGKMDDFSVYYLGCSAYLKNKLASGRPQDLADASRLREIMGD